MWWITFYIIFMILLVCFVLLMCYLFTRKGKDADVKNMPANKDSIEKRLNKKNKVSNANEKHNGNYEKLFPNVMIDDDDENVDDFDKAIDDMMFMDLMDED